MEVVDYPQTKAFPWSNYRVAMNGHRKGTATYRPDTGPENTPKGSLPLRRYERNWLCFSRDISLVNSHILMQFTRDEASIEAIDIGCNPATTPFRQSCSLSSVLFSCHLLSTTCHWAHGHQGTEDAESTTHVGDEDRPLCIPF